MVQYRFVLYNVNATYYGDKMAVTTFRSDNEIKLEDALKEYQSNKITAWKASEEAGISLWEFLDELKIRGLSFKTSEEDLKEMLNEL